MSTSKLFQDFLKARALWVTQPEAYQNLRQSLLERDKQEVLTHFEVHLQMPDEEERAQAIEGLARLYGRGAIETIVRWIDDPSPIVRWLICGCLHDFGDLRAESVLLKVMKLDSDCQVRGAAASAFGRIGAVETLPDLNQTYLSDREVDQLGHTPSSAAFEATTSILRSWVSRQIDGVSSRVFVESTSKGILRGKVTAESIPFDSEGRINHTLRYSQLPMSAFGFGWASRLDLQTSLIPPFEVEVEYVDPTFLVNRILVYQRILDSSEVDWSVHSIVDVDALRRLQSERH